MLLLLLSCSVGPVPQLQEPLHDATVRGVRIVSPRASDPVSGTVEVEAQLFGIDEDYVVEAVLAVDGVELERLTSPPLRWQWNTSSLPSGPARLDVSVATLAGTHWKDEVDVEVSHDVTVTWVEPDDGTTTSKDRVDVVVVAESDDGIVSLEIFDGERKLATSDYEQYRGTIDVCPEPPDPAVLEARATSTASTVASAWLTVYRRYPLELDLSYPVRSNEPTREVTARVSTSSAGASLSWVLDGDELTLDPDTTASPGECGNCVGNCYTATVEVDLSQLRSGSYELEVTATDVAGDEVSTSVDLDVDRDVDDDGRDADVWNGDDCDDDDETVYDRAPEYCDRLDNDCDGEVDEDCSDDPGLPAGWTVALDGATAAWYQEYLGWPLVADDLDGDGRSDLAAGSTGDYTTDFRGSLVVIPGPVDAYPELDSLGVVVVSGTVDEGRLGYQLAGTGDHDGDGLGDLFVAAENHRAGGPWFIPGSQLRTGTIDEVGEQIDPGGELGLGEELSPMGDNDGDGVLDIVLTSMFTSSAGVQVGGVYFFPGPYAGGLEASAAEAVLTGTEARVVGMGPACRDTDWDGDGVDDVLVPVSLDGSPTGASALAWSYGPITDGTLEEADGVLTEVEALSRYARLSPLGDTDGDGYPDLGVGLPWDGRAGPEAGVFLAVAGPLAAGPIEDVATALLVGEGSSDYAGNAATTRDGLGGSELLLGAPGGNGVEPSAGVVYVLPLPLTGVVDLEDVDQRLVGTGWTGKVGSGMVTGVELDDEAGNDLLLSTGDGMFLVPGEG